MPRSVGITISAVVVILGSAAAFLGGALMVLGSVLLSRSSAAANLPMNSGVFVAAESALVFSFGGWGLASGIGLLYLKSWARISTLVFAGFLVCMSLPAAPLILLIPLPNSHDLSVVRFGMALFYGVFAALGGFWLYFFNTRSVKVQFQQRPPAPESAAGDLFLAAPIPGPTISQGARPLSITIIGWFLVIGSGLAPLGLLFNRAFFPGTQLPFYFLGFFVFGWGGYLALILWAAAQIVAAAGLLRLKKWGLFATIGSQCLAAVNAALPMVIPGQRARFQQVMEAMTASVNARLPQPAHFVYPAWIGLAMAFPVTLVILWLLITRRHAFSCAAAELARR